MDVFFSSTFKKQYKKVNSSIRNSFQVKLTLFLQDKNNSQLRNHALKGKYMGLRSINVTGDWRALYKEENEKGETIVIFILLGTHGQLYK